MRASAQGLFIGEGTSDIPLAGIVEGLLRDRDVHVRLSTPDLERLSPRTRRDVQSRLEASLKLLDVPPDVLVIHRDADAADPESRKAEVVRAVGVTEMEVALVPVIPVRSTEAWLLLDERAIRKVAGNPNGRVALDLPGVHEVEDRADPKSLLQRALLTAGEVTGRRRDRLARRFPQNRRQLLEGLDPGGPIRRLESWRRLEADVDRAAQLLAP